MAAFAAYQKCYWNHPCLQDGTHDPLADIVKDEIWPSPFKYFNQEIDESDFDMAVGFSHRVVSTM